MALTGRGLQYLLPGDPPDLAAMTKANADNLDAYRGTVDSVLAGAASGAVAKHRALTFAQQTLSSSSTVPTRITLTASAYDRAAGSDLTVPTSGANAGAVVVGSSSAGVYRLHCLYRVTSGTAALLRVNGLAVVESVQVAQYQPGLLEADVVLAAGDVVELAVLNVNGTTGATWPAYATTDARGATLAPMARFTITRLGG